jgi:SAM-dependent methyltransferase
MMSSSGYTRQWFARRSEATRRSADVILPLVFDAVPAASVIDVGCGLGTWLAVAREHGVERILGIDASYVDRRQLEIPVEAFRAADLRRPLEIDDSFDLALSLEVAEHLPPELASRFVSLLTQLAPAILFSAAVPMQGGTGHLNEQWPGYWADLFQNQGYVGVDYVRPKIWDDDRVRYFYAQNTVLYVAEGRLPDYPALSRGAADIGRPRSLVHPRLYTNALARFPPPGGTRLTDLMRFLAKLTLFRIGRLRRFGRRIGAA